MSKASLRRERKAGREAARRELSALLDSLSSAYSTFNHTLDPELLEASILEIRALQSRYSSALRGLKMLYREAG